MGTRMKVWVGHGTNGALVDATNAQVSVFDHGFTVADGIFETMKIVDGRVFLWPWHLERLQHSADVLGLQLPGDAHLTDVVLAVARASSDDVSGTRRLRLTITGGDGPLGSDRSGSAVTVVCAAAASKAWPPSARLHIASWPRNEHSPLAGAKSTSYAENVMALEQAHSFGASETIFFNTSGMLAEGTGSNIFIVNDGVVATPPTSDGLLAGITRRFVLSLGDADIRIAERSITRNDLDTADEVFLTSSTRDIQPVDRVNDRVYRIGPITQELQRRFAATAALPEHWS